MDQACVCSVYVFVYRLILQTFDIFLLSFAIFGNFLSVAEFKHGANFILVIFAVTLACHYLAEVSLFRFDLFWRWWVNLFVNDVQTFELPQFVAVGVFVCMRVGLFVLLDV